MGNQPAINHVTTGFSDQIVLEEVRVLIKEGFNLCQFLAIVFFEVVLSL